MRRFTICGLVLGGVVLAGMACLLACYWLGGPFSSRITAAQFRSQIETELPPGTPREQIERWFKERQIQGV
jgi:hypothetical protein